MAVETMQETENGEVEIPSTPKEIVNSEHPIEETENREVEILSTPTPLKRLEKMGMSRYSLRRKKTVIREVVNTENSEHPVEEIEDNKADAAPEVCNPSITNNIKGKEISDDIEKDINIDINIRDNSSCNIRCISYITINYYNNNDHLRRVNKNRQT